MKSLLFAINNKNRLIAVALLIIVVQLFFDLSDGLSNFFSTSRFKYTSFIGTIYVHIKNYLMIGSYLWLWSIYRQRAIGILIFSVFMVFIILENLNLLITLYDQVYKAESFEFVTLLKLSASSLYILFIAIVVVCLYRYFYNTSFHLSPRKFWLYLSGFILIAPPLALIFEFWLPLLLIYVPLLALCLLIYLIIKGFLNRKKIRNAPTMRIKVLEFYILKIIILVIPFALFIGLTTYVLQPMLGEPTSMTDTMFGKAYPGKDQDYDLYNSLTFLLPGLLSLTLLNLLALLQPALNYFKTDIYWNIVLIYLIIMIYLFILSF